MIKDQDLNDFKSALKTYFKYNPDGPKTLQLNYDIASKLLNLLENLDETTVVSRIDQRELKFFPENEWESYIKADLANKLANYMLQNGYIKYVQTSDPEYLQEEIRATAIVLNTKSNLK